jgi:hypothetical protein
MHEDVYFCPSTIVAAPWPLVVAPSVGRTERIVRPTATL